MSATCANCRFFSWGTSTAFPECNGMCRRNAPVGATIKTAGDHWQLFPPMNSTQWCGDHRPIPEALPVTRSAAA